MDPLRGSHFRRGITLDLASLLTAEQSVCRILRSMAMANQGRPGLDFDHFIRRLDLETLNDGQKAMLSTRLQLLRSFLHLPEKPGTATGHQQKPQFPNTKKGREQERNWWVEEDARMRARIAKSDIWSFEAGTLTIVDLSCPSVDEGAACAMFNISLTLFLEDREKAGRIVALDEAHKVRRRNFLSLSTQTEPQKSSQRRMLTPESHYNLNRVWC